MICSILGDEAFPVRGILFDKQDGANWKVPWHQDVTIAVREHVEADGYGPWSMKAGLLKQKAAEEKDPERLDRKCFSCS
ncbi:MAG: hypothetical protein PW789_08795 [Edaphobacter sp.]|uniref:hypothetical protein n=1 Tax=Edaphobacter sp. TaxID=1934404 RepID=UPI00239E9C56|nr:hypothetical protein [Edaphobacter sp.]MDE1176693.1 hypothetical protein [Edaphobacter sp.]